MKNDKLEKETNKFKIGDVVKTNELYQTNFHHEKEELK